MTTLTERVQMTGFWDLVARRTGAGLLLLLPLGLTYMILKFAYDGLDGVLQPLISAIFGNEIEGLGFGIILAASFLVGALAPIAVLKYPAGLFERVVITVPVIGPTYRTLKQIFASGKGKRTAFSIVARIEYPRRGTWSVGFLTGTVRDPDGQEFGIVYLPSTPMPQSGWLVQVPMEEIQVIDWSSNSAMKYIVSAGVTAPEQIAFAAPD